MLLDPPLTCEGRPQEDEKYVVNFGAIYLYLQHYLTPCMSRQAIELAFHSFKRLNAYELLNEAAVLQNQQRRNSVNMILAGDLGVLVGIELGDPEFAA